MTRYQQLCQALPQNPHTWLITGVAGFIGSNLDEVQNQVTPAQWASFKFVQGDIRDLDDCHQACQGVDYVLHQAALGSVPRSVADPITTYATNISGFLNMLVAARDAKVKRFVYAASSSTYGDHPALPKVEDTIGKTYALQSMGLRYFNVFGPRQDPNGAYAAVIPKWIASMINNETVYINGDGETSRDFCFIANAVQANLLAATIPKPEALNQVYNVAVGERTTLNELYAQLHRNLLPRYPHLQGAQAVYRDCRTGDVRHSLADISKAATLLGYQPTHRIGEGMGVAMGWYVGVK